MKNTILLVLTTILLFSCEEKRPENYYSLEINSINVPDGTKVYLFEGFSEFPFDSTTVENEYFKFEGKLQEPKLVSVFYEPQAKINGHTILLDPNQNVILKYETKPGVFDQDFSIRKENIIKSDLNNIKSDYREYLSKEHNESYYQYRMNWSLKNPNNPIASYEVNSIMHGVSQDSLNLYVNSLDQTTLKLTTSQSILKYLNTSLFKGLNHKFKDFTAFDLEGEQYKLSDLNNKPILLDFWASWCIPCHKKNQELLSPLFEKYGDKINFISYSIDTNKKTWRKSTERDTYKWTNLSNLKGWNTDPVTFDYEVNFVPRLFLIDKNGIIVFDNNQEVTNEVFEKKLTEILN